MPTKVYLDLFPGYLMTVVKLVRRLVRPKLFEQVLRVGCEVRLQEAKSNEMKGYSSRSSARHLRRSTPVPLSTWVAQDLRCPTPAQRTIHARPESCGVPDICAAHGAAQRLLSSPTPAQWPTVSLKVLCDCRDGSGRVRQLCKVSRYVRNPCTHCLLCF